MSRIGKKPIIIPAQVEVKIEGSNLAVKGPKGELRMTINPLVKVEQKDGTVLVIVADQENNQQRAIWGLMRTLIANMVQGVTQGFEKKMEINGVGFRAAVKGQDLILNVGFSHPVNFSIPDGIAIKVEANVITVSGIDKQLVGETAAQIRTIKKPEPYKGKGIKYVDEQIRR
ncbi:MAG: 50S ribosomal protein L6, partial [bacterium]